MSQRKQERGTILRRRTKHDDDLPDEIVLDILSKLPVKSLLRFRCVCKPWYSYIANPSFIINHQQSLPLEMSQRKEARPPMILRRRTKHDLPEEIVLEILARLPVKSLLRFRCVCKTWYSYITSPNFISTHLLCYNNHDGGYVIHIHSQICTLASDRTFETISEVRFPFTFQSKYSDLVGSCNGILCITDFVTSKSKDVYLWNPSIRKFKRLPLTCLNQTQVLNAAHGFGYDSLNNDYKVVRISWNRTKWIPPPEVEVYSLSSDSWKRVVLEISWRPNVISYGLNGILAFPFVSGHLHWMIEMIEEGGGQERRCTSMILSFDVNSEKFKELPVPDEGGCIAKCLTSYKEKLALVKFGHGAQPFSRLCSIWVMREYSVLDSWNKLHILSIESLTNFVGFTNYGLLLVQTRSRLFFSNSELKRKHKSVLIDPETLHEKEIQVDYRLDVAAYMENLALLDGANVLSY
ncbi:F-box/kelch-repeat protein At3g23880-like isoform X1 [Quercus lobata]|uniref:F-box domain-containing protein n=1 Tax=Quercus lobata TaxID=97700 RepID=A0A7N2MIW1_QUELO|nr:F-box/kelch-repeat protein At3g23880-like isoform X1 [Quercus lobata]XP_030934676.1 F-box/kelch-repeat protein At3g23880-like isoform X1 [Quercus lobata]XP_030934677.1 F-box/kelch-repeat protein At3g23880-like isoform X1 [Quercus lobata]XP_030934678.1 F-box/kelch-repeat protein At3g23880-like isoform X1 [Quercus lobata]XP_030934679.1 F-box/kelch-repeat protein At3g23880-like isoform X1 [Quercus lobata]